ncbi:MAG: helix-turn-helix domain-containing protein [Solirubrobacteraceae bacterium]
MPVIAHIAGIPVQEWSPFVVPVIVLYLIGRRSGRLRRAEVRRLPAASEMLDAQTVQRVLARWAETRHGDASARHVPLFYPPGPEGMTPAQLAAGADCDAATIDGLLSELEELGYVEHDGPDQSVVLTIEGYDLLSETEAVLLETNRARQSPQEAAG